MVITVVLIRLVHKSCIEIFFPSISPREKWEIVHTQAKASLHSDVTNSCILVCASTRYPTGNIFDVRAPQSCTQIARSRETFWKLESPAARGSACIRFSLSSPKLLKRRCVDIIPWISRNRLCVKINYNAFDRQPIRALRLCKSETLSSIKCLSLLRLTSWNLGLYFEFLYFSRLAFIKSETWLHSDLTSSTFFSVKMRVRALI